METRKKKIEHLLRDEVSKILEEKIDLENGVLVTVLGAFISRTLEHATIYISIIPSEKEDKVLREIEKNIYSIQQVLNKKLAMRPVPKIRFEIDPSGKHAEKIDKLLSS